MSTFRCPECDGKIKDKNYDSDFEMYECPGCEGMFLFDELLEHRVPGSKATGATETAAPKAKGKNRREAQERDEQASEEQIERMVKTAKKADKETRHRDQIPTGMVLNIIADEIESIGEEIGVNIDRLNAREFYAMNLYRPLMLSGIHAREQDVPMKLCEDHI